MLTLYSQNGIESTESSLNGIKSHYTEVEYQMKHLLKQFGKALHTFYYEGYYESLLLCLIAYVVVIILLVAGGR